MHQSRILGRGEALLRDPRSGASNLAAAPGTWFELAPAARDERYETTSLALTLAGRGLLSSAAALGGSGATLEVAVEVDDGYGRVRDVAALVPHHTAAAREWSLGLHEGTMCDPRAGSALDGSARAGLRGEPPPANAAGGFPAAARWTGPPVRLRHGASVVACSWEVSGRADASGDLVAPPTLELALGQGGAGNLSTLGAFTLIAQTADELSRGSRELALPLAGDFFRWRVTLPYLDPGVASPAGEQATRTAVVFRLCAWIALAHRRWVFGSLGEILERSELVRHLQPGGWDGTSDVALLRLPLETALRGGRSERLRARLTGQPGSLSVVELHALADLRHDLSDL